MTTRVPLNIPAALATERAAVESLLALLGTERKVLAAAQADQLDQIAPRKRELLISLATADQQRNRLLEQAGMRPGRPGMEAWLGAHHSAGDARQNWQTLLQLADQARRLNEENGSFISANLRANEQALSALMAAARSTGVYGPGGRTLSPLSSRPLASA